MHRHVNGTREEQVKEEQDTAAAPHAVAREAHAARVWIFGGGLESQQATIVATDGKITDGPHLGTKGVIDEFVILEVPSREVALLWAAKIAVACRCAQQVGRSGSTRTRDRC